MSFTLIGKHEKDPHANRDGYVHAMLEMMKEDPSVVHIDCDLMACIDASFTMQKEFPNQVYNAGIAEANAVGVAAGMAATGKKAYVHTFGCFASRRVFDQAFLSAGYSGLNVNIIGSDPGVTAAFNGATHMPFEDCGMYMSVPNTVVVDSVDYAQTKSLTKQLAGHEGLSYMRLIRKDCTQVYAEGSEFTIGKGVTLKEGKDVTIISSGIMVDVALQAQEALAAEGITAKVIDMHTWKPLDEELVIASAKETGAIVTAENHQVGTGLGAAIATVVAKNCPVPMELVGIQDRFGQVGPQNFLQEEYNLMPADVVAAVKKAISRK